MGSVRQPNTETLILTQGEMQIERLNGTKGVSDGRVFDEWAEIHLSLHDRRYRLHASLLHGGAGTERVKYMYFMV